MAKVISVSTNKGGVLKTSTVTNLAGCLALEGKRVLIIDTDSQGNASISFGNNPDLFDDTLYDVLIDELDPKKAIQNVYENIDILPSNDDMAFFEWDIASNLKEYNEPLQLLKQAIVSIKDDYDFIIVDTPPNLGIVVANVFNISDHIIIPFQPETYAMRSLQKTLLQIREFQKKHELNIDISVLGTLIDTRTYIHSEVLQQCRQFCFENGVEMYDTVIPRSIRYANSVAFDSLPATLSEKGKNLLSNSYFELKEEIFNG